MKLTIQTGDNKLQVNGEFDEKQIFDLLKAFDIDRMNKQEKEKNAIKPNIDIVTAAPLKTTKPAENIKYSRPKVLPKVNDGRTLETSLGENEEFKKLLENYLPEGGDINQIAEGYSYTKESDEKEPRYYTDENGEKKLIEHAQTADNPPAYNDPVKARIHCPECNAQMDQTARFGNRFVKCLRCKTPLLLQPAIDNLWGKQDESGAYYFASKVYSPRGSVY